MGKGSRARGRHITKAIHPGAVRTMAAANGSTQPRGWALADAVNAVSERAMRAGNFQAAPMPRDPRDEVVFGPNWALPPQPIDPARPDTKRPEPRVLEYPVSWNLPGAGNPYVPWKVLYAASENVDIMRRCIEIRKRDVRAKKWSWRVRDDIIDTMYAAETTRSREDIEAELRVKLLPDISRLTKFFEHPWKSNGLNFGQWINGILDQHLTLDAIAIYPQMSYGGQLLALEIIDASTIKPLLDYRGARPQPPFPAFQQSLYGYPRGEFTASVTETESGLVIEGGYLADQLFYHRENFRPNSPYGMSATEQALISARLYLKRQGWMLAEYDDGSTPLMWLAPDGTPQMREDMTPRQRREWENSLNDELTGNTAARHRVKVAPPGFKPIAMPSVDERYKSEYDLFLIKMLASPYGVTSTKLGFSESQGLGNSGLHEGQDKISDDLGTDPDVRMLCDIINTLATDYAKAPTELVFDFSDPETQDSAAEDAIAVSQRGRGVLTLNGDRRRLGLAAYDFPEADMPMLLQGATAVPIEGIAARLERQDAQAQRMADAKANGDVAVADEDGPEDLDKAVDGEGLLDAKADELAAFTRWRRRNPQPTRPFLFKFCEPSDLNDADPDVVDFAEWEYTEDLDKSYEAWWPRDRHGRWIKRVHLGHVPEGPERPGKAVLDGLKNQAAKRKPTTRQLPVNDSSSTVGGMDTPRRTLAEIRADGDKTSAELATLNTRPAGQRDSAWQARSDALRARADEIDAERRTLAASVVEQRAAAKLARETETAHPLAGLVESLKRGLDELEADMGDWGKGDTSAEIEHRVTIARSRTEAMDVLADMKLPELRKLSDDIGRGRISDGMTLEEARANLAIAIRGHHPRREPAAVVPDVVPDVVAVPEPSSPKTAFDQLLDGGLVKHKQARQIVEQMEAHGWKLVAQGQTTMTTGWRAPDGRELHAQFLTGDKPKFYASSGNGGALTYRAALAHVVTPTHEEVGGPNLTEAADLVAPGLGGQVSARLLHGAGDASLDPLVRATRALSGYGGTKQRTHAEVADDLRAEAGRLERAAEGNDVHVAGIGYGDEGMARRQRERAGQLRQIADTLGQQAEARTAFEAERERRAGLPLDIRPGRPVGTTPSTPGAATSASPSPATALRTPADQAAALKATLDAAEAERIVSDLSGAEVKALADHLGTPSNGKVGDVRRRVLSMWQSRLTTDAILHSMDKRPIPVADRTPHAVAAESVALDAPDVPAVVREATPRAGQVAIPETPPAVRSMAEIRARGDKLSAEMMAIDARRRAGGHRPADDDHRYAELVRATERLDVERRERRRLDAATVTPAAPAAPVEPHPVTHPAIDAEIRAAVKDLAGTSGFASVADVRDRLGERHSRADVDRALIELGTSPGNHLIPVANLKALKQRDRDSAVRIGGQDAHAIRVAPETPVPDKTPVAPDAATDMRTMRSTLGPGEYKSPEQIKADAAAYRVRQQGKIDELLAVRQEYVDAGRKKENKPTNPIKIIDDDIARRRSRMEDAERQVTPFGQSGMIEPTPAPRQVKAADVQVGDWIHGTATGWQRVHHIEEGKAGRRAVYMEGGVQIATLARTQEPTVQHGGERPTDVPALPAVAPKPTAREKTSRAARTPGGGLSGTKHSRAMDRLVASPDGWSVSATTGEDNITSAVMRHIFGGTGEAYLAERRGAVDATVYMNDGGQWSETFPDIASAKRWVDGGAKTRRR